MYVVCVQGVHVYGVCVCIKCLMCMWYIGLCIRSVSLCVSVCIYVCIWEDRNKEREVT